jgi:hypothetical protein
MSVRTAKRGSRPSAEHTKIRNGVKRMKKLSKRLVCPRSDGRLRTALL